MQLSVSTQTEVTSKSVAQLLANSSAEEFADVFFQLGLLFQDQRRAKEKKQFIEGVGKAMAPEQGGLRKHIFKDIYAELLYHEKLLEKENK